MPEVDDAQRRLRIGLLDADPIRVVGFSAAFENHARLKFVPVDLATLVADLSVDTCVLGLHGDVDASEVLQTLAGLRPDVRVLLMGPELPDDEVVDLVAAGAKAYLDETSLPDEIEQAIDMVRSGAIYAPRRMTDEVDRPIAKQRLPAPPPLHLTAREREVLKLLVGAHSNREIAKRLSIEERTVKAHIAKLMRKVGVDNRIALSVFAVKNSFFGTSDELGHKP